MATKVITKTMRENLDLFVNRSNNPVEDVDEFIATEQTIKQNKKILKKGDGLIERMENKVIISEDNRQFLRD